MLTPTDLIAQAGPYCSAAVHSNRIWLKFAALGLGVPTYGGHVICINSIENIETLLTDLCGDKLTVVTMPSKKMNNLLPRERRNGGETIYKLGDRGLAFVKTGNHSDYTCEFDFFWTDLSAEESAAFERFHARENLKKAEEDAQRIFMLVDYGNGDYNFHSNKIPPSTLKIENYTDENVQWMSRLKETLFSPVSTGRLSILQGPAGTGKTRYLRALTQELGDECVAIVLPVSLAGELSHPRMLGQITANEEFEDKKLLLIIEDGDALLEKRDHASSVISDFLNIVDGLVGEIVNLHVIVTTNLQKKDFDPAVTRPGRLHSIMYFEALPYEQAAKVYKRETGADLVKTKDEYTLAEIYALANNHANGVRAKNGAETGQYL